jgi:membrane protein required for colicin V production
MIIDIIALLLLLTAVWKGIRKGLVMGLFSFLAFIIGLAAALKLSATAADYLGKETSISEKWLPVLAFIAVFIIVALLVRMGGRAIEAALKMAMLGWANRLGGIFFFVLLHAFIYSIVLFYAEQLHLLRPATIDASVVYPVLRPMAPMVMEGLGTVLPFFKDAFERLGIFFEGLK